MKKEFKKLMFKDDFMFCTVIENEPEIAREMLELILDKKISKVKFVDKQKYIDSKYESKGVRLDVYLEDEKDKVYNIEMQTETDKDLPKRSRYYHSMMDVSQIAKGDGYEKLKETYVIFICDYQVCKEYDEPIYVYEKICTDNLQNKLNDGSITVLVNAHCKKEGIAEPMKALLQYVRSGVLSSNDELVMRIDAAVNRIKADEYLEASYMLFEEKIRDAKEEGALSKLVELVKAKVLTIDFAAKNADMSVEDFEKILKKND